MSNFNAVFLTHSGPTFFGQQNLRFNELNRPQYLQPSAEQTPPVPSSATSMSTIVPTDSTVVIGKGSVPKKAPGNRKLRALVQSKVPEYINATSKMVKSSIVTDIYFAIEEACLKEGNTSPFVRYDKHGYTRSSEAIAREKITSAFRDCLHDKYKSSSKNKVAKRRIANMKKAEQKRETLRKAQQEHLNFLRKDSMQMPNQCTSSAPALVQSSCPRQQPIVQLQQQQHLQQRQQQKQTYSSSSSSSSDKSIHSSGSFQNLFNKLFTSTQLSQLSRIGTSSAPRVEFDRGFLDIDIEPLPIPELDCASTCSSSTCCNRVCSVE